MITIIFSSMFHQRTFNYSHHFFSIIINEKLSLLPIHMRILIHLILI